MHNRKFALVVGAPRHGKSFHMERLAKAYCLKGGTAVVYNVGKWPDFKDHIQIELLTPEYIREQKERKLQRSLKFFERPTEIEFFQINDERHKYHNKVFHFSDFKKVFKGVGVKINQMDMRNERRFFDVCSKYFYETFLILDDCRNIFRRGISSEFIRISSKINHAGKLYVPKEKPDACGLDLCLVFHDFASVNLEFYGWINSIIQFYTVDEPKLKAENPLISSLTKQAAKALKKSPLYYRVEIDVKGGGAKLFKP